MISREANSSQPGILAAYLKQLDGVVILDYLCLVVEQVRHFGTVQSDSPVVAQVTAGEFWRGKAQENSSGILHVVKRFGVQWQWQCVVPCASWKKKPSNPECGSRDNRVVDALLVLEKGREREAYCRAQTRLVRKQEQRVCTTMLQLQTECRDSEE